MTTDQHRELEAAADAMTEAVRLAVFHEVHCYLKAEVAALIHDAVETTLGLFVGELDRRGLCLRDPDDGEWWQRGQEEEDRP